MKKLFILLFIVSLSACSVDTEISDLNSEYEELNATVNISEEDCSWISYDFEEYGQVSVINDEDLIYIKLVASSGYELTSAKMHAAEVSESGSRTGNFPTVGNGNLPPGKMEFNKDAVAGSNEIIFELDKLKYDSSEILIAVQATFTQGEHTFSAWAGDEEGKAGGWLYFQYDFQNCEQCKEEVYAGPDYDITFTTAYQMKDLDTGAKIDRFFANLVTENENNDITLLQGTFEPSIQDFKNQYLVEGKREFIITYTVGEGVCEDSAAIKIEVEESDEATIDIQVIEE